MVARTLEELDAWRLANELKLDVYALTDTGTVKKDFDYRDQLRDAAASGPRNIAEGFGRFEPRQFRSFLDIAIGSIYETSHHLRDGVDRKHFTPPQIAPLLLLARRASAASIGLKRYLRTAKRPPERKRRG